jgi:hypothetical protein
MSVFTHVSVCLYAYVYACVYSTCFRASDRGLIMVDKQELTAFCMEAAIMLRLRHPNVCAIVGACTQKVRTTSLSRLDHILAFPRT